MGVTQSKPEPAARPFGLLLFGYNGSGKGTQAENIKKEYGFCHISTGDALREEVAAQTPLGKEVSQIMAAGKLVADDIVIEIVKRNVTKPACNKGFILDGFPRTDAQAKMLDNVFNDVKRKVDLLAYFDLPIAVAKDRCANRWVHAPSGRVYNLKSNPPKKHGVDDVSGESLTQRADDKPEKVETRLKVFQAETLPVLSYYRSKGVVVDLDAAQPQQDVWKSLDATIKKATPK
jgi:adenylate kinase